MRSCNFALSWANRILDFLSDATLFIARVLVVMMMVIIMIEVVARYVFNSPTSFASEFVTYLMVGVSLLAINYILREKGHIKVDIVVNLLSPKIKAWLTVVTDIISILAVAVIFTQVLKLSQSSLAAHTVSLTVTRAPIGVMQLMMPVGFGLLLLEFIRTLANSIRSAISITKYGVKENDPVVNLEQISSEGE